MAIFVDKHTLVQALFRDGVTDAYTDAETYSWGGSTAFTTYGYLPGVTYQDAASPAPGEMQIWERFGWYTYESESSWNLRYFPPVKG